MIWAAARPGVETLRFRAPDGTVLASVDGAATASGRKAAARFLDNVSAFVSQSNILPEQDTPQDTGASDFDHGARGKAVVCVTALDIRGMVCGGAVPAGRRASPGHRAPDAAADAPCPTDAARSAWSERSLLRLPCRSRTRTAFRRGPVARMGSLIAGYALCPVATRFSETEPPLSETAELLGEPSEGARQTLGNLETLFRARTAWTDYRNALAALSSETGTSEGLVRLARPIRRGN